MKIVNRKEFLKMPQGTLFFQCEQEWDFSDLCVKFDSLIHDDGDGDFVSMPFYFFECDSSNEWADRLEEMKRDGASYPLDLDATGRDGLFQRQALFLVYERPDMVSLRDFMTSIIDKYPEATQ